MSKKKKKNVRTHENKYKQFSVAPLVPGRDLAKPQDDSATEITSTDNNLKRKKTRKTSKPKVSSREIGGTEAQKKESVVESSKTRPVPPPPVHVAHPSGSAALNVGEFDERLW